MDNTGTSEVLWILRLALMDICAAHMCAHNNALMGFLSCGQFKKHKNSMIRVGQQQHLCAESAAGDDDDM